MGWDRITAHRIIEVQYTMTTQTPIFFRDQNEFRKWLEKNHKTSSELFILILMTKTPLL
jgi:hypothetical protein